LIIRNYYIQKGLDVNLLFTELSHYITVLFDKKREKIRRKIAEQELRYRVSYEDIISDLSTHFINLSYKEIDNAILSSLKEIVKFESYDCCGIIQLENNNLLMSYSLPDNEFNENILVKNVNEKSYLLNLIKDYYSLHIVHIDKINENARLELESIGFKNYPSLLSIPLTEDENSFGMLLFGSKQENRHWTENNILFLRMVGEMISRALLKKRLEKEIESRDKDTRQFITNLQRENENLMDHILGINSNIKEFLQLKNDLQNSSNFNYFNLNELITNLKKEFSELKINIDSTLIEIFGNFDITYQFLKLLFENTRIFKQTSEIRLNWKPNSNGNELHISNDGFSIFYDIPSALNDISSGNQYRSLLLMKTLLSINKWHLEIKDNPEFVFVIKNIITK
jgi:hypothetical protein